MTDIKQVKYKLFIYSICLTRKHSLLLHIFINGKCKIIKCIVFELKKKHLSYKIQDLGRLALFAFVLFQVVFIVELIAIGGSFLNFCRWGQGEDRNLILESVISSVVCESYMLTCLGGAPCRIPELGPGSAYSIWQISYSQI